jgi:hypothetical protein
MVTTAYWRRFIAHVRRSHKMLGEWVRHAGRYGKNAIGLMLRAPS